MEYKTGGAHRAGVDALEKPLPRTCLPAYSPFPTLTAMLAPECGGEVNRKINIKETRHESVGGLIWLSVWSNNSLCTPSGVLGFLLSPYLRSL